VYITNRTERAVIIIRPWRDGWRPRRLRTSSQPA